MHLCWFSSCIKREISTMKLVKHPNIVQLLEVMASKTKIYFVMEYVTGGELFNKINRYGKLKEDDGRKYFQQLINAVDYCHSRGVYHRDLKPENLLLDSDGNLKISDFGLSALPQQCREDGLLHTTCGTPNYVAPEVIVDKGYDGAKADLWSCGVILYVLLAGFLPFDDKNITNLYKKIYKGEFNYPPWFSSGAKRLISRILTPNPKHRITMVQVFQDSWFRRGFRPAKQAVERHVDVDDVHAVFNQTKECLVMEQKVQNPRRPTLLNAFELISLNRGLNLSGLFENKQDFKHEKRFTSSHPAPEIISKMEETVKPLGFDIEKCDYKMNLRGSECGRKGCLSIATEVFEVAPTLFMIEMRKDDGDTLEYRKFCDNFSTALKDVVWNTEAESSGSVV
ncbi:hypothetical protein KP509_06G029500 [Ceratopteris richardii]|uniref:non-specific serine/threonine protein kinase n=1 Tax=Ceratopteris richardii TaxID=49495 RepID=A0A8T2UR63_CERRI|nr:hypothetical protein KP509_06G029500 [Ceratopteris richardii]